MITTVKRRRFKLWQPFAVFGLVVYAALVGFLPAPAPVLEQTVQAGPVDTGQEVQLDWPHSKQAAVGALGHGVLESYGDETPLPMASITKVVTALTILKQRPLAAGETGPVITLSSADVAIYHDYVARNGSVVGVAEGEQITQYQAMQAMLIPSANNIASSLAVWAFGSEASYVQAANTMLNELGFKHTRVADTSGFSPESVSTARELVLLGERAMQNPIVADIVGQSQADVPVAGTVYSTNRVMGQAGIDGIKTGHTEESGGCFLFTAVRQVDGVPVRLIAAIMGAPTIGDARAAAPGLLEAGFPGFGKVTGVTAGSTVAKVRVPWAAPAPLTANAELTKVVWRGSPLQLKVAAQPTLKAGTAGTVRLGDASVDLILKDSVPAPSFWWRLTHPHLLVAGLFG